MTKLDLNFLKAINECEVKLFEINFNKESVQEEGYSCYVKYKRAKVVVEFLYGPPEYEVQMIIYTKQKTFEFKDLLGITSISAWVDNNRYVQHNERNLKDEILWFIELLKASLPIINAE